MRQLSELLFERKVNSPTISSGTLTLNLATGRYFNVSLNADVTTLVFSNVPSGVMTTIEINITQDSIGSRTVIWPGFIRGNVALNVIMAPLYTTSFLLSTTNGGATWNARKLGVYSPEDVYNSSVVSRLSFTESPISSVFYDHKGHAFTATGNVRVVAGAGPFGDGAIYIPSGETAYITSPTHADFNLGIDNFTVEMWLNTPGGVSGSDSYLFTIVPSSGEILSVLTSTGTVNQLAIGKLSSPYIVSGSSMPLNKWVHLACVKNGNNYSLFINGIRVIQANTSITYSNTQTYMRLGCDKDASQYSRYTGYISNVRYTVGVARYTGSFTPDSVPFTP